MNEEFPLINRVTERGHPPRPVHAIVCSQCREEDFISALNTCLPPHTVAARFQRAGWVVRAAGKHLCPTCAKTRRAEARLGGPAMLKTTIAPVLDDATRRSIPLLYVALEDKYDRAAKAYRGDATDESIAAELHLPAAIVAERRAADFGPLVESEAARRQREAEAERQKAVAVLRAEQDRLDAAVKAIGDAAERVRRAALALAATTTGRAA
jgi:hypothetical protein